MMFIPVEPVVSLDPASPRTVFVTVFHYRGDWWKLEVGLYLRLYHGKHRLDASIEEEMWELVLIE